jgi:RimJ/RimL family protein N-acetyltransferase
MGEVSVERFTTPRLVAERLSLDHFPEINRLHTDPSVMHILSADAKPLSEEATREHLRQAVKHWRQHGFGFWIFRAKSDGQFVGRGGLKVYQIDSQDVIGLAYAVLSVYWNQGFATEMAEASLKIGFEELGFSEIASWTLPTNTASQRIMEKLGFRYERDFEFAGLEHRFYRMAAGDWQRYHGSGK